MKKKIVQDAFRQYLPPELYNRPKHGFEIPLLDWFRKELRSMITDDLLKDDVAIVRTVVAKIDTNALSVAEKESVAKINQSRDKHSSSQEKALPELKMPDSLPQLHLDGIELVSDQETSYQVELASRLRLLLRLPEYGDVKIRLTVSKAGRVEKVEIIGSESKLNSQYVENTLPSLQLPPFGNQLGNTSKYTFAITLSND